MKTNGKYILDEKGDVVECNDLLKWAEWFETSGERRKIAYDDVGDHYVSTVFLGLDYSFGGKKPILFETMVFEKGESKTKLVTGDDDKLITYNKSLDEFSRRYSTREEAVEGHRLARKALTKKYGKKIKI